MAWHWATRSGVSLAAMASLVVEEPGFQVTLEGQLAVKLDPEAVMRAPPAVSTLTTAGCWHVRAHISGVWPHLDAFQFGWSPIMLLSLHRLQRLHGLHLPSYPPNWEPPG